jgi:hypothetical protein
MRQRSRKVRLGSGSQPGGLGKQFRASLISFHSMLGWRLEIDMLSRFISTAFCIVWGIFICFPAMGDDATSRIAIEVTKIRSEPGGMARTEVSRLLSEQIRLKELAASDSDIDLLADMLSDKDDSVRYWIAMALGNIGPRAQKAVPSLEKAYSQLECVHADKSSESAIRIALTKIGATVHHRDCPAGNGIVGDMQRCEFQARCTQRIDPTTQVRHSMNSCTSSSLSESRYSATVKSPIQGMAPVGSWTASASFVASTIAAPHGTNGP